MTHLFITKRVEGRKATLEGCSRETNLLSPVHHLHGRVDALRCVPRVLGVNVLPVLTVSHPAAPPLPVPTATKTPEKAILCT